MGTKIEERTSTSLQDVALVLLILNNNYYERTHDGDNQPYCIHYDHRIVVTYWGVRIWDEVEDGRKFSEKLNDYEPLYVYLVRESKRMQKFLSAKCW